MSDEIHIPEECRRPKPHYFERPDSALVKHIKEFIKETGQPHMWHGHTHTKPPKGARIDYLDEYDLPKRLHKAPEQWAVCPCCSPTHPKYYKGGKIGWFPDEGVIRLMGPDCFAALDKVGHRKAIEKLRAEQQLHRDTIYLLAHLTKVPDALRILEQAQATIEAVDNVRDTLRRDIPQALKAELWPLIKDGKLQVKKYRKEQIELADGKKETREVEFIAQYSEIKGQRMLEPSDPDLAPSIRNAISTLRSMNPGHDAKATIAAMPEEDRKKNARALGRSLNNAKDAFAVAEELRLFLSVQTVATLRNWGMQDGCPIRIHVALDGLNFLVGRTEHENRRFIISRDFFSLLGTLPTLAETDLAA